MNGIGITKKRHEVMSNSSIRSQIAPIPQPGIVDEGYFGNPRKRPAIQANIPGQFFPSPSDFSYPAQYGNPLSTRPFPNEFVPPEQIISLPYFLLIPNELIGLLIGTGGSSIKEIENISSAILYFDKANSQVKSPSPHSSSKNLNTESNENVDLTQQNVKNTSEDREEDEITYKLLSIYGTQDRKNRAVSLILGRIRSAKNIQDNEEKDSAIIGLPLRSLPLLIGHKGITINGLTHRSGCQIVVQKTKFKDEQLKAVSVSSVNILGLVNCISMIYETFQEFIYQGKLNQDDFMIIKDEKSNRYAKEACAAASAEAMMARRKFSHPTPPTSSNSFKHEFPTYFNMNDGIANSTNPKRIPTNIPDSFHRNKSSLTNPNDNLIRPYVKEDSFPPLNYKTGTQIRINSHDNFYPSNPLTRTNDLNRHGQPSYENIQNYNRAAEMKLSPPFFNESRKKDYGEYSLIDKNRYGSRDNKYLLSSSGMVSPGQKMIDTPPLPFSPQIRSYSRFPDQLHTSPNIHDGNLLTHPYGQCPTPFHIKFVVSSEAAAWVVGKRGDHVKEVKHLTGAEILISDSKNPVSGLEPDERLLTFTGSIASKFRALQTLLLPMLSKNSISNKPFRMLLPLKSVSFVIGYRGLTINQITQESKADVNVERNLSVDNERPITISGAPTAQWSACLLLFKKVEEFYNADIAAQKLHFPSVPPI